MSTEPLPAARPRRAGIRRAVPLALVFALCAAALAYGPAARADGQPPSPGEKIADALRSSPVYVDPAYEQAVPPRQQRALAADIEEGGIPVKVVLVPLVEGDPWGGESAQLAEVVHDRLTGGSDEELVLITTSDMSGWLDGHEWPGDEHQASDAANAVGHQDDMDGKGLAAQVARAVDIVQAGNGHEEYEKATADLGTGPAEDSGGAKDAPDAGGAAAGTAEGPSPLLLTGIGAAVLLALVPLLVLLVRRRRRRGGAGTPFSSPRSVFAAAREEDERALRRRAHDEVVALGEDVSADTGADTGTGGDGGPAALRRALDAYAAAGTVLDAARGVPDLAGVLALVAEGRDALRGAPASALPLCFFHPLHGRAVRRVRWRPLGRRDAVRVAACGECATALRTHRVPEVLTDQHEGRDVPYFEVPPAHSVWAATGYGSLTTDPLALRITRGGFTRTTHP